MTLNDIAKEFKVNGFVESEKSEKMLVHPEARDFFVVLYYDKKYDDINIGDFRNYVSLPASAISKFRIETDHRGIMVDIALTNNSVIHLSYDFDLIKDL